MKRTLIAVFLLVAACTTPAKVGVGRAIEVPQDSAARCSAMCESIGLTLDSVVVMASNVGCVCRKAAEANPSTPTVSGVAGATGGMAAILLQAERKTQEEEQQRRRRR